MTCRSYTALSHNGDTWFAVRTYETASHVCPPGEILKSGTLTRSLHGPTRVSAARSSIYTGSSLGRPATAEEPTTETRHLSRVPLYTRLDHETPSSAGSTHIRRIREADVADCVHFGVESFRSVFASFREQHGEGVFPRMFPDWEETQAQHIESVCRSSDKDTWVYESHGAVSGFVVMSTTDQSLGEIELLAVDPQAQGHGIGTVLNQKALDRLREAGMAYAIVATANDPGHAAARRSYEKAGFRPGARPMGLRHHKALATDTEHKPPI